MLAQVYESDQSTCGRTELAPAATLPEDDQLPGPEWRSAIRRSPAGSGRPRSCRAKIRRPHGVPRIPRFRFPTGAAFSRVGRGSSWFFVRAGAGGLGDGGDNWQSRASSHLVGLVAFVRGKSMCPCCRFAGQAPVRSACGPKSTGRRKIPSHAAQQTARQMAQRPCCCFVAQAGDTDSFAAPDVRRAFATTSWGRSHIQKGSCDDSMPARSKAKSSHLAWLDRLSVVVGIVQRLVPDGVVPARGAGGAVAAGWWPTPATAAGKCWRRPSSWPRRDVRGSSCPLRRSGHPEPRPIGRFSEGQRHSADPIPPRTPTMQPGQAAQ